MNNIIDFDDYLKRLSEKSTEEIGTLSISMYKDKTTGLPYFNINPENEQMLPLSYMIENLLYDNF